MKIFRAVPVFLLLAGCLRPQPAAEVAFPSSIESKKDTETVRMSGRKPLDRPAYSVMAFAEARPIDACPSPLEDLFDPESFADSRGTAGVDQRPSENAGLTLLTDEMVFAFPVVENEKVRHYIDYFTGPARKTFVRWLQRSERYLPVMRKIFEEEGLPQDLTYLAMVESGFNDKAYSWAHAAGPWQFIESTGNSYGLNNDWWLDERRDFEKSTRAAAKFLSDLHTRFDGDWPLAVAAYNAGGGKISRAVKECNSTDFWELSRGSLLQQETKNYLPKLLAVLTIVRSPEAYGFVDLEGFEPLDYDLVTIPDMTDLELVAQLCEVSYDEIKGLNPELKRWCTPPGVDGYELRIPAGSKALFEDRYAQVPSDRRANYKHHRVARGDTLGGIAKKYNIRADDIIDLNKLKNPRLLRIGTDLILPLHQSYSALPVAEMQDDYQRSRRPQPKTYQVRKGDSLWGIAKRFDVGEKDLRRWNHLGGAKVIRPGQNLLVSAQGTTGKVAKSGVKTKAAASKSPSKIVYQVKPGDTLWKISRTYSVSTTNIQRWNNLSVNQVLRPGDKLTLLIQEGKRG